MFLYPKRPIGLANESRSRRDRRIRPCATRPLVRPVIPTIVLTAGLGVSAATPESTSAQASVALATAVSASTVSGPYMLRSRHSGLCLTAAGTGNGSAILQWPCNPTNSHQKWIIQSFCVGCEE